MATKKLYDTLVGASVAKNQLVQNGNFESVNNWSSSGASLSASDGILTMTSTGTLAVAYQSISFKNNHKYLFIEDAKADIDVTARVSIGTESLLSTQLGTAWKNISVIFDYGNKTSVLLNIIRLTNANNAIVNVKNVMLIDLTAMLGSTIADYLYTLESATAGAGVAKLREWGFFTGEYIPYNAGTLESVEATAHKMVGFNQWDEAWENGYYSRGNGNKAGNSDTTYIRSKNPIPCLPSTRYYFKPPAVHAQNGTYYAVLYYDADNNYIGNEVVSYIASLTSITPRNARYLTFYCEIGTSGSTYQNDICINLSSDRNGEYEPYSAHTYDLGTDTLRGLFKLDSNNNLYADGDTKKSDGTVTRKYGVIDLGTLNWTKTVASNIDVGYVYQTGLALSVSGSLNCILSKYPLLDKIGLSANVVAYGSGLDKVAFRSSNKNMYIIDSSYADAESFKAAMSGVMLVYELATPTTEQSTPFQNPQICDPDGTEEYTTNNGVPVGHETRYQL